MFSKQQVHVLLILWVAKRPLTHEEIERMAVAVKYNDTLRGLGLVWSILSVRGMCIALTGRV